MERIRSPKRLGDNLYDALASMIARSEFAEGARLPAEIALAQQFGVSRPIVRETLARLRDEGLIASRRGSGSYVQPRAPAAAALAAPVFREIDSFEQIKQCYEFRKAVEGEAAFLAAESGDEAHLAEIRAAIARLDQAVASRVVGDEADFNFHLTIAGASGNSWFASALQAMRNQIEVTINIARTLSLNKTDEHLRAVQAEHDLIFDAIRRGAAVAAKDAMRDHLDRTCERIFRGPKS